VGALDIQLNPDILPELGLNPKQLEAVQYFAGPVLILAGAGTGKTKTLTSKIALLIASGVPPSSILAITFTNKAAQEMRSRIARLVPNSAGIWTHTFHSFGARVLRQHGRLVNINPDFVIYDADDQKKMVQLSLEELGLESEKNKAAVYVAVISRAKDDLLDAESYLINAQVSGEPNRLKAAQVYQRYQKKLNEAGALDFGDLILRTAGLLKEKDEIREYFQDYFRYLLVDEYQDTNHAQYVLIKTLSAKHRSLCVVGDPDQSVYGWRGADIRNILEFEKDFTDAKTIVLEQNYRSTSRILHASNEVIKHNKSRKPKNLWTEKPEGEAVELLEFANETEEAKGIAGKVKWLTGRGGYGYNDIAVFYRTNAQSRSFEETFRRNRIPYRLIGSVRFYDRKEIKDALSYLKILVNPADTVSLLRVINTPARGIGKTALDKLMACARLKEIPIYDAMLTEDQIPDLTPAARRGMRDFIAMLDDVKSDLFTNTPTLMLEKVLSKSGYWQSIESESEKDPEDTLNRLGNLQELVNAVKEFEDKVKREGEAPTLHKYLEEVMLASQVDSLNADTHAVTLITVHLAKGLEFPAAFLTGLEEGLFPINAANSSEEQMEEERRLAYVGMTRAKDLLYLTWANTRKIFGTTYPNMSSRFIFESKIAKETAGRAGEEDVQVLSAYPPPAMPRIGKGRKVAHPVYGPGRVVDQIGSGEFAKVTVVFDSGVRQTFMLKYAPLQQL
jgi:DNA helicase-2/ATP-dependent DNA helicase PcrA